jgi:hypothetical protein
VHDSFDPYCLIASPGLACDPFPGPAWSMAWDGPGTRSGSGGVAYLPAGTQPVDPDPGQRYFGGGGRGGSVAAGHGLHPDPDVRELYRHGDDLTRLHGTRLYWAMNLVHPKVASSVETLVDDALGDPIQLKAAVDLPRDGEPEEPEAKLAAQILEECQASIDRLRPALDECLRPVVESMCVEFSGAAEPVWEAVDARTGKAKLTADGKAAHLTDRPTYRLKSLDSVPREAWEFVVDRHRRVVGYAGIDPDGKPVVVPLGKLAVMTWRPRAGDPRGRAMLRPAYADCDMDWRLRDPYFQHVRNFSDPFRVGKVKNTQRLRIPGVDPPASPGDPSPKQIGAAESMHYVLAGAGAAGFAVIGDEDDIVTTYPQGSGEAYLGAFGFAANNIVEAIVGDVRATQQAEYGSRAAAEVGADNKGKRVKAIRRLICQFVEGVLRTQNELNHGPEVAARLTPYVLIQDPEARSTPGDWTPGGWALTDRQMAEVDAKLGLTPREVGKEESLTDLGKRADALGKLIDAGWPARPAGEEAGFSEDRLDQVDQAMEERKGAEAGMLGDGAPAPGAAASGGSAGGGGGDVT